MVTLRHKFNSGKSVMCSEQMALNYLRTGDWVRDDLGTAGNRIAALEQQVASLQKELEIERRHTRSEEPNWQNRCVNTTEGWLNELGLLGQHRQAPQFMRSAIARIRQGLLEAKRQNK